MYKVYTNNVFYCRKTFEQLVIKSGMYHLGKV